jgi:hypothetical protein
MLLQIAGGVGPASALDSAIADRLIPQMGQLDDRQLQNAEDLFASVGLVFAQQSLHHVKDPHGLI